MADRPVNLSVHRNTKERRERKVIAEYLRRSAREESTAHDLGGFLLVTWDRDARVGMARWHLGRMSPNLAGEFVKRKFDRTISDMDAAEVLTDLLGGPGSS